MNGFRDILNKLFQYLFVMPITNGNNNVLNTEFASYITVWIVIFSIIIEGIKPDQQFTDVQFIGILSLLAGILGIKEYFNLKK